MSERLPEPTKEQVALAFEMTRRALDGEEVRLYAVRDDGSGNGRRLRARTIDLGEIEEA